MIKVAMLVAISFSGVSQSTYTIPGYDSLDDCTSSQPLIVQQLMDEPFVEADGKAAPQRSLPTRVRTKCIVVSR